MKLIKCAKLNNKVLDEARAYIESTKDNWNYITPEELHDKGLKSFYLLDVRKPEDYAEGHIKGANNIFWMDILKDENLKKLPNNKTILVICYVGHTASQIMTILRMLGFDVMALKYGMGISPSEGVPVAGWTDFGFETTRGQENG